MRTEYVKRLERQAAPGFDTPLVAEQIGMNSFEITEDGKTTVVTSDRLDELIAERHIDPRLPDLIIVDLTD